MNENSVVQAPSGERVIVGSRSDIRSGQTVISKDITAAAPARSVASDSQGAH